MANCATSTKVNSTVALLDETEWMSLLYSSLMSYGTDADSPLPSQVATETPPTPKTPVSPHPESTREAQPWTYWSPAALKGELWSKKLS